MGAPVGRVLFGGCCLAGIGGDEAHPDIAMARPLDPPRGENLIGLGIHQQREHHFRMIVRASGMPVVTLNAPIGT
jgi:hypothetical protein